MQTALVIALRARRVDVLTASDCAMVGRSDEDHLRYATSYFPAQKCLTNAFVFS